VTGSWSGALTICRIDVLFWRWRNRQCPRIAGGMSPWGESDTRAKLIDPGLHACGWTEDLIRREETAGAVEIVDGRPRRRAIRLHIRALTARRQPIPRNDRLVHSETMTVRMS